MELENITLSKISQAQMLHVFPHGWTLDLKKRHEHKALSEGKSEGGGKGKRGEDYDLNIHI
jgi:hypothetical protein